jgi:4-hydroxybenzoate polyprenyltransferase
MSLSEVNWGAPPAAPADVKLGLKSSAIFFGCYDRLIIGLLQILLLGMLVGVGLAASRGTCYIGGLGAAAALALYQQFLIRRRERRGCLRAFLNNNYFGMAVFLGLLLDYALGT